MQQLFYKTHHLYTNTLLSSPEVMYLLSSVITGMLPAGFEIENSRIKELPGMEWIKKSWTSTSIDKRDDRINLFVAAYSSKQTYYYSVRAVSTGTFKQESVIAE